MSESSSSGELSLRSGVIQNYRVTRGTARFVFGDSDQNKFSAIAIAAGVAGLGGQAVAMASSASSTEEDADYLEFDLNGYPAKGWVWRSPFSEGDEVEVVGEDRDGRLEVVAVARKSDRVVALYPHCSRGKAAHAKNAVKWWIVGSIAFNLVLLIGAVATMGDGGWSAFLTDLEEVVSWAVLASTLFFAVMTFSLARKWMPFVRTAEKVFRALGWTSPGSVDLVRSSKTRRQAEDPAEVGTFYFKY